MSATPPWSEPSRLGCVRREAASGRARPASRTSGRAPAGQGGGGRGGFRDLATRGRRPPAPAHLPPVLRHAPAHAGDRVAESHTLSPGVGPDSATLPFELTVPAWAPPTVEIDGAALHWLVCARLDDGRGRGRRWRRRSMSTTPGEPVPRRYDAAAVIPRRAAVAAVTALMTACGSSPTPAPTTDGSTPAPSPLGRVIPPAHDFGGACRLLTPGEVQASIGGGLLTASSQTNPQSGSLCSYGEAGSPPIITLQVTVQASADEADTGIDQIGGTLLSGVGDHARIGTPQGLVTQISFARGQPPCRWSTTGRIPNRP